MLDAALEIEVALLLMVVEAELRLVAAVARALFAVVRAVLQAEAPGTVETNVAVQRAAAALTDVFAVETVDAADDVAVPALVNALPVVEISVVMVVTVPASLYTSAPPIAVQALA